MNIREAMQLAKKGGWKPNMWINPRSKFELEDNYVVFNDGINIARFPFSNIFLDPLFWQALGKELGWGKWSIPFEKFKHEWELQYYLPDTKKTPVYSCNCGARKIENIIYWDSGQDTEEWIRKPSRTWQWTSHGSVMSGGWKEQWHRFIDFLADGKTAEDYFATLTKPKELKNDRKN